MTNFLVFIASIGLAISGQLLMKYGMNQFGTFSVSQLLVKVIPMFLNPWVFSGLGCFALSSVFWLVLLSRMNLSMLYPMVSLGYVVVAIASVLLFKENISIFRWISISIICFGVILLSRS